MSWLVPVRNKELQTTLGSVFGFLVIKVMALNKGYENWFSCKTGGLEGKGCLVLMRKHQKMVLILENRKNLVLFFREKQGYSFCSVWEVLIILSEKCFDFRCLSQRKGLDSQK